MRNLSVASVLLLSSILFACKKSSDPAPLDDRISTIELSVYDSQLWTIQNRLPSVAGVEINVVRIPVKFNYGGLGPRIYDFEYTQEDIQSSMKSVFKGKTDNQGKVTVMLEDTTDRRKYRWFALATKEGRTIYSPEGLICAGIFESSEEISLWSQQPGKVSSIGDRKYLDWDSDGLISSGQDRGFALPLHFLDSDKKIWLY